MVPLVRKDLSTGVATLFLAAPPYFYVSRYTSFSARWARCGAKSKVKVKRQNKREPLSVIGVSRNSGLATGLFFYRRQKLYVCKLGSYLASGVAGNDTGENCVGIVGLKLARLAPLGIFVLAPVGGKYPPRSHDL